MSYKSVIKSAFKSALPIIMGYIPIGISYGILALSTDLSPYLIVGMSIFVFAGSSQLIAVNMLTAQAAVIPIIMTTFLVNLRHILMSATLSLYFKRAPSRLLPLIGFLITDESFAVGNTLLPDKKVNRGLYFLVMGFSAYMGWVLSSLVGVLIGKYVINFKIPVIDFVLPAMFIILLIIQIRDKMDIVVSIIAAVLSVIFFFICPGNWNIIIATVLAAVIGVILEDAI